MKVLEYAKILRFRINYLVVIFCAMFLARQFSIIPFLLVSIFSYSALFYGVMVNFANDYDSDSKNPPMKRYGHITGKIEFRKISRLSSLFLILTIISGLSMAFIKNDLIFLLLTIIAIHCGFSYSSPPFRLKRFWWGGIVSYTLSTSVIFIISVLAFGGADRMIILLSVLVLWFGSLSVWSLSHISDRKFDKKTKIVTPAMKFSKRQLSFLYTIFIAVSSFFGIYVSMFLLGMWWSFIPFTVSFLVSVKPAVSILRENDMNRLRKKAHGPGVMPYRLNVIFLAIIYLLAFLA
ncbi:MAG: prenyltransferase [Candidatus Aenigmarchaeota archaeon]|nr:prenyltransferase [Candidatus Aenigmarchaeota archaeon]